MREDLIPQHIDQTITDAGQAIHLVAQAKGGNGDIEEAYKQLEAVYSSVQEIMSHKGEYLTQGQVSDEQHQTLKLVDHQLKNVRFELNNQ